MGRFLCMVFGWIRAGDRVSPPAGGRTGRVVERSHAHQASCKEAWEHYLLQGATL